MKRRWWSLPLGLVVLLAGWLAFSPRSEPPPGRLTKDAWPPHPNIVVVVIDALRVDRLPFHGHHRRTAPFLDELAAGGAVFERAYAASTWTPSSVASILTGLYPSDHHVRTGYAMSRRSQESDRPLTLNRLPDHAATLPELLRERGYRTFGASNNPNYSQQMGFQRGFDRFAYLEDKAGAALNASVEAFRAELAGAQPYFLYVHYMDTHKPYHLREEWLEPGAQDTPLARYDSELGYVDRELRRLYEALGLPRGTLVVVTADHGEEFRDHGGIGHKNTMYAELLRVPLLFSWPGVIEPRRIEGNVSLIDLLPTLVELAGPGDAPEGPGISLLSALRGEPVPARTLYAMRWTELRNPPLVRKAVIRDRWKYILSLPGGREELYDAQTDPTDRKNVVALHEETRAALRRELEELEARPPRYERAYAMSDESGRDLAPRLRALGYVD